MDHYVRGSHNGVSFHFVGTRRALEAGEYLVAIQNHHEVRPIIDWMNGHVGRMDHDWKYQEDHGDLRLFTIPCAQKALLAKLTWGGR